MDAINSQRNPTKISHSLATQKPTQTMEETIHTAVITVTSATEPMTSSPNVGVTADELVAKSIAPVKREYLRPTTVRPDDGRSERKPAGNSAVITKEKKSKRQLKRDRQQEKKAAPHLCPEVAKRGDANSCPYKDKCRFSHDVDAFKAQKPEDLEGECPFMIDEAPCPYGLSCRFLGKHKDGVSSEITNGRKIGCELNGLSKDVQKLLWKNKLKFEKADAQLKRLGLMGPKNKILQEKDEGDQTTQNGTVPDKNGSHEVSGDVNNQSNPCTEIMEENDNTSSAVVPDELRPPKKAKSSPDENPCHVKTDNGVDNMEEVCPREESELKDDCISTVETDKSLQFHSRERKLIDFREKLYLAPLTTVGNLPFRRVCKVLGADITCGEMAMCTNLLQGQASEWALLRRHSSEDIFGVQICGAYPDTVSKTVELIEKECTVDFIDINMGCPIDIVVSKGAGSALLTKPMRMKGVIQAASATVDTPVTVKVRTGYLEGRNRIDSLIEDIGKWGATALTIHGRSRQQRYSKLADWDYIYQCTRKAPDSLQVLGNGDVFSYVDWNTHKSDCPEISTCMIARGALIKNLKWSFGRKHIRLHRKGLPVLLAESIGTISVATETITYTNFSLSWDHSPWLFTEIKEQRHWDISSGERLDILKDYVRFGLQHWGSDSKGVETTRHFLLEWLSYTYRYVPVGLLDVIPQRLNWRSPSYFGRDDLETLMASDSAADWIRISELLLGKVPASFTFSPKHKSNAYDKAENG